MCCVLRSSIACALPSALYLSCFASPALSVDAGFFITSSLALHLSRFISLCCVVWRLVSYTSPFVLCLPCVIGRRRILQHFVSHFTFRASFSVLCRLTPCLCTLPFVLCLPCVISRRRILHHFVSCTSPFALHFSVLCRLAPCLLHFASQPLASRVAPHRGGLPKLLFRSGAAF